MKRLVVIVFASTLVLAACSSGENEPGTTAVTGGTGATSTTGDTGPTQTTGPTGPTAEPSEAPAPELEDGRHFGFARSVDVAEGTMRFDLAYFLTGDEATEAARDRGDEAPPPNDYYIVNDNPRLRTLALAPDLDLALLDWNRCCDVFFEGDLNTFAVAIEADAPITVGGQIYYGSSSPYWLTVEGGVVVRIEEQFLP